MSWDFGRADRKGRQSQETLGLQAFQQSHLEELQLYLKQKQEAEKKNCDLKCFQNLFRQMVSIRFGMPGCKWSSSSGNATGYECKAVDKC